jgi:hypothetical protein
VLDDPAPFVPLVMKKRGKETDYEAKTVMLAGRRYIVCRNHQEAAKDAADRASIIAALERQLAKGDKALVGNTGDTLFPTDNTPQHFSPHFFENVGATPISLTHRVTNGNAW